MSKRILVVEDDTDILFILELILKDEGIEVFTSEDGADILGIVERVSPDIILMDVRLPNADGRELCQLIRKADYKIPIILMSAHLDYKLGVKQECASDFVPKPFDLADLVVRVRRHLAA
jgi:DNA-binding response OmpR family regulator